MKRAMGFLVMILLCTVSAKGYEVKLSVAAGSPIPDLSFDGLADPADYGALGLSQTSGGFRLSDVPGEVLVFEFFNKLCMHCQRQAPFFQAFFEAASSGDLKGRVR